MTDGLGTHGAFGAEGAATAPTQPTLSVTLDGTTATATITGQAGAFHILRFKTLQESNWSAGIAISGDGDIVVSDLVPGTVYNFIAQSSDNSVFSVPSTVITIEVPSTSPQNIFDAMAIAANPVFTDVFAEQVTYHPAGGGDRVVQAIITRDSVRQVTGGITPVAEIMFLNDTSTGVTSSESDRGGDAITYPVNISETPSRRKLGGIIAQDAGMIIREAY